MILGLTPIAWEAVGFLGQGLFTARFLVQWLASEKKGESVVPVSFWWLSLFGSAILGAYAAFGRNEPVFLLVSLINGFLYVRNLYLAYFAKDRATSRKVLIPSVLAIAAFLVFAGSGKIEADVPAFWLVFGFAGTACWSGRFVIQWYASERAGKSVMPRSFWYVGLAGAVLLLSYSIYRRMPVFILGYLFPVFPYIRNLTLIFRKEGAPRPIRLAEAVWRDPGRRANAIAIFCVVLAAFLSVRAVRTDPGSDFERLHGAARLVIEGRAADLYGGDASDRFDRPPALAVVLAPMGWLSGRAAVALWTVLNGLAFLLALHLLWRLIRRDGVRAAWMWVPFLIGIQFAWDAMNAGDPMPLVLLLLVGGLERAEWGKVRSAVLLFSLVTLCSPVLGLIGAFAAFLNRSRPVILMGTLLVSLGIGILLPAIVLGPGGALELLGDYSPPLGIQQLRTGEIGLDRLLPAWLPARTPLHGLLFFCAIIWALSFVARGIPRSSCAAYGIIGAAGLGVVGCVEQEHFLLLTVPAAALAVEYLRLGRVGAHARVAGVTLLCAIALAAVPSRAIVGKTASEYLIDHGSLPAAALLLLVGLLVTGSRERDEPEPEG